MQRNAGGPNEQAYALFECFSEYPFASQQCFDQGVQLCQFSGHELNGVVVRKEGLLHPNYFGPQTLQNSQILHPAERFSDVTGLRHRSVFGAKSAQNGQLRKVCFFSCQTASVVPEPVFSRNQAPDACCALDSVFSPEKQANSIPPSLSPFVTASSPLAFGPKKCAKAAQFPSSGGLRSSQGFPRHDSQPRTSLGTRQPAEVSACDTSARRTCHRLCHRSVFCAKSAQNGQLRFFVSDGKWDA